MKTWHRDIARVAGQMSLALVRGGLARRDTVLDWANTLERVAQSMRRAAS